MVRYPPISIVPESPSITKVHLQLRPDLLFGVYWCARRGMCAVDTQKGFEQWWIYSCDRLVLDTVYCMRHIQYGVRINLSDFTSWSLAVIVRRLIHCERLIRKKVYFILYVNFLCVCLHRMFSNFIMTYCDRFLSLVAV